LYLFSFSVILHSFWQLNKKRENKLERKTSLAEESSAISGDVHRPEAVNGAAVDFYCGIN